MSKRAESKAYEGMLAVATGRLGIDRETALCTAIPASALSGVEMRPELEGAYFFSAGKRGGMTVLVSQDLESLRFPSCISPASAARSFCAGSRS